MIFNDLMDCFGYFLFLRIFTHGHDLKLKFINVTESHTDSRTKGTSNGQDLIMKIIYLKREEDYTKTVGLMVYGNVNATKFINHGFVIKFDFNLEVNFNLFHRVHHQLKGFVHESPNLDLNSNFSITIVL